MKEEKVKVKLKEQKTQIKTKQNNTTEASEENSPQNSTSFTETISIKLNVLPYSELSLTDQEAFQRTIENLIQEKSNEKFSKVEAKVICQMHERKRNTFMKSNINRTSSSEGSKEEMYLIISLSGNYININSKNKKVINQDQKIQKQLSKILTSQNFNKEFYSIAEYELFYFTNITKIELIETPLMFETFERQAMTSYGAMMEHVLEKSQDEYITVSNSFGKLEDLGFILVSSLVSVGIILAVFGLYLLRKRLNSFSDFATAVETKNSMIDFHSTSSSISREMSRYATTNTTQVPHSTSQTAAIVRLESSSSSSPQTNNSSFHVSNSSSKITETTGECIAPPGKLGVSIYPVNGVPVVYKVKPSSPLYGKIFHMDRIIGIDEIDTTDLSAAEVTKIIVSRMKRTRFIRFMRWKEEEEDD